MKPTQKYLAENVTCDKVGRLRDGTFKFYHEFFYTHGRTAEWFQRVVENDLRDLGFLQFQVMESGEVWKAFRGNAPTERSSHWFVVVRFD